MSKTQTVGTTSPYVFSTGAPVADDDARAVLEQLNWSFGYRPHTHFALTTGPDGWATDAIGTLFITFPAPTSWVERLRVPVRIRPEDVDTRVGARCVCAVAETVEVKFTIGGGTATLAFANADNGTEKTATIATSSSGTGHQTCTVEIRTTAGAAGNMLRNVRCQAVKITSGLPSPLNE